MPKRADDENSETMVRQMAQDNDGAAAELLALFKAHTANDTCSNRVSV